MKQRQRSRTGSLYKDQAVAHLAESHFHAQHRRYLLYTKAYCLLHSFSSVAVFPSLEARGGGYLIYEE